MTHSTFFPLTDSLPFSYPAGLWVHHRDESTAVIKMGTRGVCKAKEEGWVGRRVIGLELAAGMELKGYIFPSPRQRSHRSQTAFSARVKTDDALGTIKGDWKIRHTDGHDG